MSNGRYYLSRVIKLGELNQEKLINTICNPPIVEVGKFDWTFTDVKDMRNEKQPYIFGKLSKYAKLGHIKVVDEVTRTQKDDEAKNLLACAACTACMPSPQACDSLSPSRPTRSKPARRWYAVPTSKPEA